MSYELDEDILQDFLVEAGEILELLSEQLVELENNPNDKDLLNAIFRGFHTVKGGAGFLSLTELVDTCHGAENVFDILRNGQREVTASLMDTMLKALDTVNEQFQAVQDREPLEPAEQSLLDELHRLSKPASEEEVVVAPTQPEVVAPTPEPVVEPAPVAASTTVDAGSIDEITQDEFEKLLDELHGAGAAPGASKAAAAPQPAAVAAPQEQSGDITDDEFEKLLDELHGVGQGPGKEAAVQAPAPVQSAPAAPAASGADEDLMTDDEFEKLLDQLHGQGKGPSVEELEMATKLRIKTQSLKSWLKRLLWQWQLQRQLLHRQPLFLKRMYLRRKKRRHQRKNLKLKLRFVLILPHSTSL